MYVFMKEGPIHIVQHRDEENTTLVRGWSKTALERFADPGSSDGSGPGPTPEQVQFWYDEKADYCWRMTMPTEFAEQCLAAAFSRIDYTSLKAGVADLGDDEYYDQLVAVHGLCKKLMDNRRCLQR